MKIGLFEMKNVAQIPAGFISRKRSIKYRGGEAETLNFSIGMINS